MSSSGLLLFRLHVPVYLSRQEMLRSGGSSKIRAEVKDAYK